MEKHPQRTSNNADTHLSSNQWGVCAYAPRAEWHAEKVAAARQGAAPADQALVLMLLPR
jgi:hypothetical protein